MTIPGEVTAEQFKAATGSEPVHDDLNRCNCSLAGHPGHVMCGWCDVCNKPRFVCGHVSAPRK